MSKFTYMILLTTYLFFFRGQDVFAQKRSDRQKEDDFKALINKPRSEHNSKIRLNGSYHNITLRHLIDSDLYALRTIPPYHGFLQPKHDTLHLGPVPDPNRIMGAYMFFENGIIAIADYGICNRSIENRADTSIYKRKQWRCDWGTYQIRNDSIYAIVFVTYGNYGPHIRATYFSGVVTDSVTISGWHEIPPYHHENKPTNKHDYFEIELPRIPQTLKFISCPGIANIDPARSWIMKYKEGDIEENYR